MEFRSWILTEKIDITVTSSFAGDGGHPDDHLALAVRRVDGPEMVLMRQECLGDIEINGVYEDLGDDFMRYVGIFDYVEEQFNKNTAEWMVPEPGFTCEMGPEQ